MNDSLSRDERIRLEALNQSVASFVTEINKETSLTKIIERARSFERFIRSADYDNRSERN